jgi:hypothetical protein
VVPHDLVPQNGQIPHRLQLKALNHRGTEAQRVAFELPVSSSTCKLAIQNPLFCSGRHVCGGLFGMDINDLRPHPYMKRNS